MDSTRALLILLYAYPLSVCTVLLSSCLVQRGYHWSDPDVKDTPKRPWKIIGAFQAILVCCFVVSAGLNIPSYISAVSKHDVDRFAEGCVISHIALALYFSAGLLPDPDGPFRPSKAHYHAWLASATIESISLGISLRSSSRNFSPLDVLLVGIRIAILLLMCITYALFTSNYFATKGNTIEHESLLSVHQAGYGTAKPASYNKSSCDKRGGWIDYFIGFRILFPYLWPSHSRKQQLVLFLSLVLLIAQRIVNILVPYQLEQLIRALGEGRMPYSEIAFYTLYRGLQGQQGVLGAFRSILWIPLSQSLFRRLTCAAFEHILGLSLEFHSSKNIGEVLSALNKGSALNTFLDSFAFQLFPMVLDLGVAAAYFLLRLDPFYSLIIITVMWCYVYVTIYMAMFRSAARRDMANKNREMEAVKMDTIMSYEIVHHYGAMPIEMQRFEHHVNDFQTAEWRVLFSLNMLNITQNLVLTIGILLVVLVSSLKIHVGMQSVAVFVGILGYFTQLQAPLQFFGSFYSQVQNNLVDAERMLELFKQEPTIVDSKDAQEFPHSDGTLSFSNVSFAYDGRQPVINDISFTAESGTSTAIVGESGSGKSTLFKLMFRFYDITKGSIKLDGHNIQDIKLQSLRSHFGVVPQDTILFHDTIFYNLQYAKPDATMDEVYAACRAASIHERILSFPDGYDTKVGERGMRLSGGEKQRIAIARALLKNPQIALLDEATSSLDSHTERQIQTALDTVATGRTTITIAHRLSTITKYDQILVMHQGSIVERGTHAELLALGGRYFQMWGKQTKTKSKDAD